MEYYYLQICKVNFLMQTSRLILREFQPEDAIYFYEMNEDWDCVKYTGDVAFKNLEEAENLVKNYHHYQKYGFGRWTVLDKSVR